MSAAHAPFDTEIEILLIEDDVSDADLTVRELGRHHFTHRVHVIGDGAEALDFIFCRGAYAGRSFACPPKVILLDMKLPRVDGLQILAAVKKDQRTRAIPVVIMTASNQQRDLLDSYHLGVNAFIEKPTDLDAFRDVVERVATFWLAVNRGPPAGGGLPAGAR